MAQSSNRTFCKHPKNRGGYGFADAFCQRFIKEENAESLREIVLNQASIVEEILARDPIRWYHFSPRVWDLIFLSAALTFSAAIVVMSEIFH